MAQELTFNISEDRRNLQGPVEAKNFNLKFGTDGVAITHGNPKQWVQGRIGDNELKQVFVNITEGENNTPKDVAGLFLAFVGIIHDKDGRPHRVVDYKHSTTIDVEHGRFRFDFPDQAFTVAGEYQQAFFMLVKEGPGGGCVATMEFDMQVMANFVFTDLVPEDYITPFNDTVDQLLAACKKFKDDTAADEAKFKQELEDAYAKFQKDTNTQLNNFKDATDEDLANFKKANADDIAKFKQQYADAVQVKEDELQSKVDSYTDKIDTMLKDLNQQGIDTTTMLTDLRSQIAELQDKIKSEHLFSEDEAKKFEQSIQSKIDQLNYEHLYPTLIELQNDKTLGAGQVVKTGGYYSQSDGGSAIYDIVDTKPADYYEPLQNGLYAKLRYTPRVLNVAQWGVNPSQEDNYEKIQMIFDKYGQGANIYFPNGTYKFSKTLILSTTFNRITGDPQTLFKKTANNASGYSCTFNKSVYDFSQQDIALIIGPTNKEITTTYHHSVELNEVTFVSENSNDNTRQDRGIVAVGTAYLKMEHSSIYGYMENFNQYNSFGFNASQTESTGARNSAWIFDSSIHARLVDCASESTSPITVSLRATNKSSVYLTNVIITMNAIQSDNSNIYVDNCSFETNANTLTATDNGTLIVSNSNIEHHQDPACKGKALVHCTDNSTVIVSNSKWNWSNYSGDPTWDEISSYVTNKGCRIVVIHCQFDKNFPTFTHYDGGANYVIWDNDFDIYKKVNGTISSTDSITILGETLERDYGGHCFLNVGFRTTKDIGYMDTLLSFPPNFIPWDGCYIQFLQQSTKKTYQAFTSDGKIKVYNDVPAGTQAILTFSYQAKD
ncbi:BppU family phage baseplate upper protein [Limosilactobacillus vaginalis]|uniref:BppU family phage baseplate upper protein n=1 Tax=Limosilactobacillus vaginalis TaxID=1633 RepID=UPI0025A3399D|nr:BppU family phage baseplate upper protein [Limosilactobacillus vaginalis]MDM8222122.1 BppU family phage baseplate upper protein [Limosilactobacillus vaginalis]